MTSLTVKDSNTFLTVKDFNPVSFCACFVNILYLITNIMNSDKNQTCFLLHFDQNIISQLIEKKLNNLILHCSFFDNYNFITSLLFSYNYRQQHHLTVPNDLDILEPNAQELYIQFLVEELVDFYLQRKDVITMLNSIINPLLKYNSDKKMQKDSFNLFSRIILVPKL